MIGIRGFSSSSTSRSMIGRRLIKYTNQVSIDHIPAKRATGTSHISVNGPLGKLDLELPGFVNLQFIPPTESDPKNTCQISVADPKIAKQRAMWGTSRALISNMIIGVHEGYTVPLRFEGVGYRAALEDGKLVLKLGFANPVILEIPEGVKVTVPAPQRVLLQGVDKQKITQFAANIRKFRKPEPYNQKGIFVGDETIKKKEGKKR